ncbi:hypothetical protein L9F63_022655 [Diploptera punctata]|uniref:Uncharacterized protein n=1 Tax=Diploptera punctata TaxID=6984 RepID=A0AAD7ZMA0_DIPPU|nr:hypothetical protein L9F63_022655 [Diploptera punctata]
MVARLVLLLTCAVTLCYAEKANKIKGFKVEYVEIQTPDGVISLNGSEPESWEPLEDLPSEVQEVVTTSGVQWLHNVYNPQLWGPSPPVQLEEQCNQDMKHI